MNAQNTLKRNISQIIGVVALFTFLLAPAFGAKPVKPTPDPDPASDVVCDGCVDTSDIASGAVTLNELGDDVFNEFASKGEADRMHLSPIAVDGEGNTLGTVISAANRYMRFNGYLTLTLLSTSNYLFEIISGTTGLLDRPHVTYFDGWHCQGNAYLPYNAQGQVFRHPKSINDIYYTPRDGGPQTIRVLSHFIRERNDNVGLCDNESLDLTGRSIYLNDPAITGVANKGTPDNPYTAPITLERP